MPYKNIVFVKLEKRLLNDFRWFGMSDKAQLLYIKLMLGCAETYNKLPTDWKLLGQLLHINWKRNVIESALKEIQDAYPKFQKDGDSYYFKDFHEKTNYIRDCPSSAQVVPKVGVDKEKDIDIDIDKEEDIDVRNLFIKTWSRSYNNLAEMQGAEQLVKQYGYNKVYRAFRIAGENNKLAVSYVRGILEKSAQKETQDNRRFKGSDVMNNVFGG